MPFKFYSSPLLLIISGPAGVGKTTVALELQKRNNLHRVVTCTTRQPRTGEVEGRDYHFLVKENFRELVAAGEFLETAIVHGENYGTRRESVLAQLAAGHDVLLTIDVQGAASISSQAASNDRLRRALVRVFLMPDSYEQLQHRLTKRNTETNEQMKDRLKIAEVEVNRWPEYDYVIRTTTVEEDVCRIETILASERLRSSRLTVS